MTTIRRWMLVAAASLSFVAAACSSSTSSSPSAGAPPASSSPSAAAGALCSQEAAVKASFEALVGTNVVAEGTTTLQTRFDTFASDLATLRGTAKSQFSSEFDAVQSSVDQLKAVVDKADTQDAATTAAEFVGGVASLKTTTQALFTAIDRACS